MNATQIPQMSAPAAPLRTFEEAVAYVGSHIGSFANDFDLVSIAHETMEPGDGEWQLREEYRAAHAFKRVAMECFLGDPADIVEVN